MSRSVMYPEGAESMNVVVSRPVKLGVRTVATRRRQSVSQVVSKVLEDYLKERGELPESTVVAG